MPCSCGSSTRDAVRRAGLVGDHLLDDAPATAGARVPEEARARLRPARPRGARRSRSRRRSPASGARSCQSASASATTAPGSTRRATIVRISPSSSRRMRSTAAARSSRRGAISERSRSRSAVPSLCQAVEAPRAALGVLPLARDEAVGLQRAQQRVHRVRVDGDDPAGQLAHALHELVAVGRRLAEQVQDEQPQQARLAQAGEEWVGRPRPTGRRSSRRSRRGADIAAGGRLGDGRLGRDSARGHRPEYARRGAWQRRAGRSSTPDPYAVAVAGSSMRRGSSVSRAMTRRWICDVPS